MKLIPLIILAIQFLALAGFSSVDTKQLIVKFESQGGSIDFFAVGKPSAIKIHGKGSAPKGDLIVKNNEVSGFVTADLNSFDTGIELRNKHMKEKYLEVAKFPEAKLTLEKMTLPTATHTENFDVKDLPFEGIFKLHGVDKKVSGQISLKKENSKINLDATFKIKIADYNMGIPSFSGITVADEVTVNVSTLGSVTQTALKQ